MRVLVLRRVLGCAVGAALAVALSAAGLPPVLDDAPGRAEAAAADPGVFLLRTATGQAAAVAREIPAGARVLAVHRAVDVVVVRAAPSALPRLRQTPSVHGVTPDAPVRLASTGLDATTSAYDPATDPYSLLRTTELVGARKAWRKGGTGAGVDVAVIDSGVAAVPGLGDTGRLAPGVDLSLEQAASPSTDAFGHGTHMAGIVAGRDPGPDPATDAGDETRFLGVAPGARVVPVRVGDRYGATDVSQVIAGLDWVVRNARTAGRSIRVVNLSFGTDSLQGYVLDPLAFAAERAWHSGLVVVVSAGNGGRQRLSDPAYDPYVLAVGASDTKGSAGLDDDVVPAFSNRGDGVRNPDLVAPGRSQQSLRVAGSHLDTEHGHVARRGERFFRGTGTSQAAAVVSGAAAVVLSHRPDLQPDQVKALLRATARPLPGVPATAQGAGMLDVAAAVAAPAPGLLSSQQHWTRSLGLGSVGAARGTPGLLLGRITGSIGDHGVDSLAQTNDPVSVAAAALALSGQLTTDVLTRSWDGNAWDGNAWDGNAWDGNAWDGNAWDGNAWDGNAWDGNAWDGNAWDGHGWK